MNEYHKIVTVFERDPETKFKTLIEGKFALPEFDYLKNNEWVWTEKVDGTNIRVLFDGRTIAFMGKSDNAQLPGFLLNRLRAIFEKHDLTKVFDGPACLYGEGYGAKIQKGGGNYRQDQDFVLFDVKVGDWWLQQKDIVDVANKLELEIVPIIKIGTLNEMVEKTKIGFKSQWGDFLAEGIVARPRTELKTRRGDRIITKIKHKDWPR